MTSSRRNLLALGVLSYLSRQPMHPYELGRTLRQNADERSIKFNHGSLYMVVGQLEKAGFVVAQESGREGRRPKRTVYAITDAGRTELHVHLRPRDGRGNRVRQLDIGFRRHRRADEHLLNRAAIVFGEAGENRFFIAIHDRILVPDGKRERDADADVGRRARNRAGLVPLGRV